MTPEQIHQFQHTLIITRIQDLITGDLSGRRLQQAREILAFTLLGHDRLYPDCPTPRLGEAPPG